MSYEYGSSIKMLVNSKSHFPEKLMDELIDIYRKAEAFDEVSKISRHVFIKDKDKLKMIDKVVESEAD